MVNGQLLMPYVKDVSTGKLVTSEAAKNSLGTDVGGFVIPMFSSQTAIAYNADMVKDPPKSFADIATWAAANPKKFGYNGIKGGMSGVSFVVGWVYANAGDADTLMKGPYKADEKNSWDPALAKLKAFNQNVVLTPGNAGTLDMLNRGEIAMGPVWVDMFYTWQADGKLPPNVKLKLSRPACPASRCTTSIPAKAANREAAEKFIELATSPQVQADGIVKRFNWYPGHRRQRGEAEARRRDLEEALRRRDAGRPRREGQDLPDRAVFQRHPRGLREEGAVRESSVRRRRFEPRKRCPPPGSSRSCSSRRRSPWCWRSSSIRSASR